MSAGEGSTAVMMNVHSAAIRFAFDRIYDGQPYGRFAALLEQSQFWPWARIERLQMRKLRQVAETAYHRVPFYRQRFDEAGLQPDHIRSAADLWRLPILTKRDIQLHHRDMVAVGIHRGLRPNHTSGSTGHPLTFLQDDRYRAWGNADTLRCYRLTGYHVGDPWAFLWSSDYDDQSHRGPLNRVKDRLIYNLRWINAFDLRADTLAQAVDQIVRGKPTVLVAFVSAATMLARVIDPGVAKRLPLRAIQTSAEVLTPDDRALLETTFDCPVFNRYGCREVGNIAHECDAHSGLHVLAENNIVEIVDDTGQPVRPGEVGRVIVTNLNNRAMPLLRYEVGDLAVATGRTCSCGRSLPMIESIQGRATDVVRSPAGKMLYDEFFAHLLYRVPGIHQFRVIQETLHDIRIEIVPLPGAAVETSFADLTRSIRHEDPAFRVRIERCDYLAPGASGKFRYVISTVGHAANPRSILSSAPSAQQAGLGV